MFKIMHVSVADKPTSKRVIYFGFMFDVPLWVQYIATDKNGCICGYATEPYLESDSWYSFDSCHRLDTVSFQGDWEDSLVKF